MLEPLASALDYAHAESIVHRDVKPTNVLFTERGRLVLSDFGVARMLEATSLLSQAGLVVGTPMYMSPEQAEGQPAGPASDRYSLGVIVYEMLTGRPPFTAETPLALLRAHVDKPLPPPRSLNPALSDSVEAVLFTILAKDPADRFPSGEAFVEALRRATKRPAAPAHDRQAGPTPLLEAASGDVDTGRPIANARSLNPDAQPEPTLPTAPLRETAPTLSAAPEPPTLPLAADDRLAGRGRWLIGALGVMAIAWALAWCLVLGMRYIEYEPVYRAAGWGLPQSEAAPWISARLLVGAIAGLIGGGSIWIGLILVGRRLERSDAMLLIGGWALSYAAVHAAVYMVASGMADVGPTHLDRYLTYVSYRDLGPSPPSLVFAFLVDVLPALLGGCLTAMLLGGLTRMARLQVVLGWSLGAALGLIVAMLLLDRALPGSALYGFRTYGMLAGLLAGIIQGVIGGWLTVRYLPGLGPRPGYLTTIFAPQ